jgi:hypothetical protein
LINSNLLNSSYRNFTNVTNLRLVTYIFKNNIKLDNDLIIKLAYSCFNYYINEYFPCIKNDLKNYISEMKIIDSRNNIYENLIISELTNEIKLELR